MPLKPNAHTSEQVLQAKPTNLLLKFLGIFCIVFLTQIPGCIIVFADDAGQINSYDHPSLIEFSVATFIYPLKLLVKPESDAQLLTMYIGNLVVLSLLVLLILFSWTSIKKVALKKRSFK